MQFISGAVLEAARNATPTADGQQGQGQAQQLLLSMGINDCEAKRSRAPEMACDLIARCVPRFRF